MIKSDDQSNQVMGGSRCFHVGSKPFVMAGVDSGLVNIINIINIIIVIIVTIVTIVIFVTFVLIVIVFIVISSSLVVEDHFHPLKRLSVWQGMT